MTYDDDLYDEAIKWSIEEIVNEIYRIKELDSYTIDEVYYTLFQQDVEEAYENYLKECQTP